MAAGDIVTFHRNGIWFNRIEGEAGVIGSGYDKKADAVVAGRGSATARQVDQVVHDEEPPADEFDPYARHPRDRVGVRMS